MPSDLATFCAVRISLPINASSSGSRSLRVAMWRFGMIRIWVGACGLTGNLIDGRTACSGSYIAHASSLRLRSARARFARRPVGLASALTSLGGVYHQDCASSPNLSDCHPRDKPEGDNIGIRIGSTIIHGRRTARGTQCRVKLFDQVKACTPGSCRFGRALSVRPGHPGHVWSSTGRRLHQ